jgi:serine/threonine-protein kinase HipA
MASKLVYIFADWDGLSDARLIGILRIEQVRGQEIFSFEYEKNWLTTNHSFILDPDLQSFSGPQYLQVDKVNFGFILDSSPDRWGKLLMQRREAVLSKLEKRQPKTLTPSDYLLGVFDEHRMGALRFKTALDGPFLNDNREMAAPPWTSLRELEFASFKLEAEDSPDDPEYLHWLNLLLAPGSSLGGARPKASVMDNNSHLWIAKFPSMKDLVDVGGWEMVAHELAKRSGLSMPDAMIQKFNSNRHTFLTKRFDRTFGKGRIHFASVMTLLGQKDGDDFQSGISYLDMAGLILRNGDKNHVNTDLEELWRRIVFSICIKNTDDHLRNHGFLLRSLGWRLSPAYDINPNPAGTGLTLNISEVDNSLSLELAIEVAGFFRIGSQEAKEIVTSIKKVVRSWHEIAVLYGLPKSEQERMAAAFVQ